MPIRRWLFFGSGWHQDENGHVAQNSRFGPAFRRDAYGRLGAGGARSELGHVGYPAQRPGWGGRRYPGSRQPEADLRAELGGGQAASEWKPAMGRPALGPDRHTGAPD